MKNLFCSLLFFAMAVLIALPTLAQSDTLDITPTPVGNINEVINGDTTAGGLRANPERVYRLGRGFVYLVTEPIRINGPINIVATDGTDRPPVLAPATLPDDSNIDHFFEFIGKGAAIDIRDIYLLSIRTDQNWLGWSAGMRIQADSISLKLRGVIFDAFSEAGIRVYANWTKVDVQDCYFRNHQHSSSWFGGQPYMTDAPNAMDTVKFINNTFFANNSYSWSIRGYDKYSVFEHNTMVLGTVNPFLIRQASNIHMKNNLFYAMHAMGGNPEHVINGWFLNYPDTASSSIYRVRGTDSVSFWSQDVWGATISGPEAYVDEAQGVTLAMLDPSLRTYDVRNNAYLWPQQLTDFYNAWNDTVVTQDSVTLPDGSRDLLTRKLYFPTWISDYAQWTLDTLLAGVSNITYSNNFEADPEFDASVTDHLDNLINYVRKIAQTGGPDSTWHYPNVGSLYPPAWPLPENLAFSNTALQNAGTDGYALGDLNWFPDQKEQWATGVEEISSEIPDGFSLSDAYPNPFNPETKINFNLAKSSNVKIIVYNILGQKVKTLVNQQLNAGSYSTTWNGRDDYERQVASGVYLYSLETESFKTTKKVMLMK